MSEKSLRKSVSTELRKRGWHVDNIENKAGAGFVDTLVMHYGAGLLAIEFKGLPANKLRASQLRWIRAVGRHSFPVLILSRSPRGVGGAYRALCVSTVRDSQKLTLHWSRSKDCEQLKNLAEVMAMVNRTSAKIF